MFKSTCYITKKSCADGGKLRSKLYWTDKPSSDSIDSRVIICIPVEIVLDR